MTSRRTSITQGLTKLSAYLPALRRTSPEQSLPTPTQPLQRAFLAIERSISRGTGISAALGDRWAIVGITRSGKTTFAKQLIEQVRATYPAARIYIIDSKYMGGDFENYPGIIRSESAPDPVATPGGVLVWQSPYDDIRQYDTFLRNILKAGKPAFIHIDELSSLSKGTSGTSYPIGLSMLLKQGGGLGIGASICSQGVARIPAEVLNQATHLVRFPLELSKEDYDARKIDKRLKREPDQYGEDPEWYSFYYRRNQGQATLHHFRSYRDFFSLGDELYAYST